MRDHRSTTGEVIAFDGSILYLPVQLCDVSKNIKGSYCFTFGLFLHLMCLICSMQEYSSNGNFSNVILFLIFWVGAVR